MNLIIEVVTVTDKNPLPINILEIEDILKNRGGDAEFKEYVGEGHESEYPYCTIDIGNKKIYSVHDSQTVWAKIRAAIIEQIKNK